MHATEHVSSLARAKMVMLVVSVGVSGLLCSFEASAASLDLSAEEVKSRVKHRLDGQHFTARVRFEIKSSNWQEVRELLVWRDDEGNRERLMAQFQAPAPMRGTGLLYIEGVDTPNNYFIYQPSGRRVRRIPESLITRDIYGVDLEYMGFGVAQLQPIEIESMEVEDLKGRKVYRLTERAKYPELQRFDERVIWVDPETFVPLRTEHYDDGKLTLRAQTTVLKDVSGIPTPVETVYEKPADAGVAHMTVESVDYESEIPPIFFSTLQLTKVR